MASLKQRHLPASSNACAKTAVAVVKENRIERPCVKVSYPGTASQPELLACGDTDGGKDCDTIRSRTKCSWPERRPPFSVAVGLLNGKKAPADSAEGGLFKTRKGHKLTFNDNTGSQGLVQLELNDGKKLSIDDNGIKVDDGKGNSIVIKSNGGSITIQAATDMSIKAPKIAIEASGTLDVKAGGTLTLKGSLVNIN